MVRLACNLCEIITEVLTKIFKYVFKYANQEEGFSICSISVLSDLESSQIHWYFNTTVSIYYRLGESENNLRKAIDYAKKNEPVIIFFDEIDGLFSNDDDNEGSSNSMRGTNTDFLMELNDIRKRNNSKLIVIG